MQRLPSADNIDGVIDAIPAIVTFPGANLASSDASEPAERRSVDNAPCALTQHFVNCFEAVSGWEVRFVESFESQRRRSVDANRPFDGRFEIIDLSANWPADRPAMHRAKCDQLIESFSQMFRQMMLAQTELLQFRTALDAITNRGDDDLLVDSFVPTFDTTMAVDDDDWVLQQSVGEPDDSADFVVRQEIDSSWLAERDWWTGWSIAGATGIAGGRYLDWNQCHEHMSIYVGRIESSFGTGDAESRLDICADQKRFRVCDDQGLASFFVWDRRGSRLTAVDSRDWQTLPPGGAIVVSTSPTAPMPRCVDNLSKADVTAEQLSAAITGSIATNERLLVIKRNLD